MIVTCPSCTARYKINASKIKGRGAKITCPKCSHRFVVYRGGEGPQKSKKKRVPANVATWDFRTLGLTWRVRRGAGNSYDFFDLNTLRSFIDEGQVELDDAITYDNRDWSRLSDISDLDAFFYDVWEKAKRGEVSIAAPEDEEDDDDDDDEDDADAPTTIVGRGSELANELRQAVAGLGTPEAVTRETIPHPEGRGASPGPSVTPAGVLVDDDTPVPMVNTPSFSAPAPMEAGGVAEVFRSTPQPALEPAGIGDTLGPKPAPLPAPKPQPSKADRAQPKAKPADAPATSGPNWTAIAIAVVGLAAVIGVTTYAFFGPKSPPPTPLPAPAAASAPAPQRVAPKPTEDKASPPSEAPAPSETPAPADTTPSEAPESPKPAASPKPVLSEPNTPSRNPVQIKPTEPAAATEPAATAPTAAPKPAPEAPAAPPATEPAPAEGGG